MKALFYTGTQMMEVRDTDAPEPQPGEVIIDIAHCGICGSDMHAYHGHDPRRVPPMILGHEAVGIVRTGGMAGKRVAVNPLLNCKKCDYCHRGEVHLCEHRDLVGIFHPGAYAQVLTVPEANLTILPDRLDFATASLAEPLACGVHGVRRGFEQSGQTPAETRVAVLGGGAIGLLAAMVYAHQGVKELWVAETNPVRRNVIEAAVNARAYDPRAAAGPEQVDLVFDAVGSGQTRKASSAMVSHGGMIVHIGLQDSADGLDTRRLTLQEIGFLGVYCYQPQDFAKAVDLLADGIVTLEGWSEIRPLDQGPQSFEDIHNGKAPPKIILSME